MLTPQAYLSFIDGHGHTVRQRISTAILVELDRLPLPQSFNRQTLAEDMAEAALNVFADSNDHGLETPFDD